MTRISIDAFVNKYLGKSVDYDKAYGIQCVDLFNYYNSEVVGAPWIGTPKTGGARDLFEVSSPARNENYKTLLTGASLQAGDVLVYGEPHGRAVVNGKLIYYGHVNIYLGDNTVLEQNGKKGPVTAKYPLFKNGLIGVLRPFRFITQNSPPAVSPQPSDENKHIIKKGDTFWGLEEMYNIPHGTLQEINPGIDPRALTIGRSILLRRPSAPQPSPEPATYTIRAGDTFWALERTWGLPTGRLSQLNPGIDPRKLGVGQRIRRG